MALASRGRPVAPLPLRSPPGKPLAVFVLRGRGAGVGTRCALVREKYGCTPPLSAGERLRDEKEEARFTGR